MADASKASRSIFIGNIPYGLTEEQIVHTFSTVGNVLNFRLVYDQETGRPKGFGFAEFSDADSAASAVRNLNGHEVMGRELRVDFSHPGGKEQAQQQQDAQNAMAGGLSQQPPGPNGLPQQPTQTGLPPLPPGVDLPPHLTCPDAISKTLSSLPPPQLLDILSQMKGLVMGDPARATELLAQAPHLAYAIFQALLLMGLVDTSVLASVVETQSNTGGGGGPAPPIPPPHGTPLHQQPQQPPHSVPQLGQQQHGNYQGHIPQPYQQYPGIPGQMNVPTPPAHNQPYPPPPMQHQAPPGPPQQQQQPKPQEEDLIKQVLAMTQQQVDSLPPAERAQIIALRQQLTGRY